MLRSAHLAQSTLALLLATPLAPPLSAGMISNTGFESNYSGWKTLGDATIDNGAVGVDPKFGNSQALLRDGTQRNISTFAGYGSNVASVGDIEIALGLPSGIVTSTMRVYSENNGTDATMGSAIWQEFMGSAGQEITFCWKFLTNEIAGSDRKNPDLAFVSLVEINPDVDPEDPAIVTPDGSEYLSVLAAASDKLAEIESGSTLAGNYRRMSGYNQLTLVLPSDGIYRLGFGIVAAKDEGFASALLLDDPGEIVPEPSAILLVVAGGLCLVPFAVNRRKRLIANRLS